ncbi:MAG: hypothetical protein AAGD05_06030 [Bacteroidota bacterium]
MTVVQQDFILLFSHILNDANGVLMSGELGLRHFLQQDQALEVLIPRTQLHPVIERLQQLPTVSQLQHSSSYCYAEVHLQWQARPIHLLFLHKLAHRGFLLLDEQVVLRQRRILTNRLPVPAIEHLFEYLVLNNYLNHQGIGEATYGYFCEFHILVKEGLIEYFNQKYQTNFETLAQLTDFRDSNRLAIIKSLKSWPMNQLKNNIQLRWNHFLGNIRQARIFLG